MTTTLTPRTPPPLLLEGGPLVATPTPRPQRRSLALYIASPRGEYPMARLLARSLGAAGHRIVSTWHTLPDLDAPGDETLDPALRRELLERCRADIQRAEVMIAWTARGTPKATIGEIVCMAEALGRPVIWIQGPNGEGGNIWDEHDNVTIVREHTVDAVLRELARISAAAGPTHCTAEHRGNRCDQRGPHDEHTSFVEGWGTLRWRDGDARVSVGAPT